MGGDPLNEDSLFRDAMGSLMPVKREAPTTTAKKYDDDDVLGGLGGSDEVLKELTSKPLEHVTEIGVIKTNVKNEEVLDGLGESTSHMSNILSDRRERFSTIAGPG